jgi:hypothetical protein
VMQARPGAGPACIRALSQGNLDQAAGNYSSTRRITP